MRSLHSKRHKESFSLSIQATGMDKAELNNSMSQLIGSKGFWFRQTFHKYQHITSLPTTSSDPGHPVCLNLPWQSPSTRGAEGPIANSLLEHSWGMTSWNLECHWETQRQGLVCDKPAHATSCPSFDLIPLHEMLSSKIYTMIFRCQPLHNTFQVPPRHLSHLGASGPAAWPKADK